MKVIVFLACALAIATAASEAHKKNMEYLQTSLVQLKAGYAIDTVLQALQAVYAIKNTHLQEVIDIFNQNLPGLQDSVDQSNAAVQTQTGNCATIASNTATYQRQREVYAGYIQQAQDSIQRNIDSLAEKEQNRCAANLIFIDRLKDAQDTLGLLKYLRSKLTDPSFKDYLKANSLSLAEVNSVNRQNILSFLSKHHLNSLLLQQDEDVNAANTGEDDLGYDTQARTDEEIGTGHIDNDQGALTLDKYETEVGDVDTFIAQLVSVLDDLIAEVQQDSDDLRDAELSSVEDFIQYKAQLARENLVLQRFIQQWGAYVEELDIVIAQNEDDQAQCQERLEELTEDAANYANVLAEKVAQYQKTRASLEHLISALEEIIRVYVDKVANAPEEYKARVDDYLDNHRFDDDAAFENTHTTEVIASFGN